MASRFRKFSIELCQGTGRRKLRHEGSDCCVGFDWMATIYVNDLSILKDGVIDVDAIKENIRTALSYYHNLQESDVITATQCGRFSDGFMFNIAIN